MHLYDEIDRHPSFTERLKLGATILAGTALIGLVFRFALGRPEVALALWIAGPAALGLAVLPGVGRVLYVLWMGLGLTIGAVTSPILLLVVYVTLVVPVGLIFRIAGRDALRRRPDPAAKTYWEDYPSSDDPARYVRQF